MTSVEIRSKSTQQRKQQRMRRELQDKFDWILNEKYPSTDVKTREKMPSNEDRNQRYAYTRLHPSIQKVESIENMQLLGVKSAIQELQELATPTNRQDSHLDSKQGHLFEARRHQVSKGQNPESFKLQDHGAHHERKDSNSRNKMEKQQNQTVHHYKEENQKLKTQLKIQTSKNQQFIAVIKKLEYNNSQLEKEINLLLQKWQREQSNVNKINSLQQEFKQQLLINLQLEELLLKQKLQMEKKNTPEDKKIDENFKNIIRELDQQLNQTKKMAERETQALKLILEGKEKEIKQLKQVINERNRSAPQGVTSLQSLESPLNMNNCHFMERFSNFSKEMQAKLSQNHIVSTNPSLQDTATIGLQVNRKHSQSQYSKGNCPSVELPLLTMRQNQHKGISQTDRI